MNRFRQKKDLPVYLVASSGHAKIPVRQGKISDLVVGNSKVELVVAEQKACALVSYQEDMAEKGSCAAQKRKRKYICQSFCLQRGCLYRGWK